MHSRLEPIVHRLLARMLQDGLPAARELFSELNYDYADAPLPLSRLTERERAWVHGAPRIVAQAENHGSPFQVIHVTLSAQAPAGRGFPLSITAERALAQRLLQDHPDVLLLFSDVAQRHWHLANVRDLPQRGREGDRKLRRVLRRIAVGPQERLRTAVERISMLDVAQVQARLAPKAVHAADIKAVHDMAFDVEQVTKQFFGDYVQLFLVLRKHIATYLETLEDARDYAQQFLNRLMFLYFVQRKGWLGNDPSFMANFWQAYGDASQPADTFVSRWLDVLFFEALNNGFKAGRADRQHLPDDIRRALTMAPYLNGGLFERNELDSDYAQAGGTLPDALIKETLGLLERYNFTIAEDTPLDQEIAVDPEMLGHVYESLVNVSDEIDERGEAGIFYTPRIEIDLMCRLALVERLSDALGTQHRDRLYEAVFAYDPEEKEGADRQLRAHNLWPGLDDALQRLTVCDPACGSGSFLVGMLHVLDDLQARADAELGRAPRPYERKQRIIERSLYGVDVKRWAVRVAELRLWLQLVVENDAPLEELQFRPLLPSLEFKLRVGDSLVQQVAGVELAHRLGREISPGLKGRLTRLQGSKSSYFQSAGEGQSRDARRQAIEAETRDIFVAILQERLATLDRQIREKESLLAPHQNLFGETGVHRDRAALERQRAALQHQRGEAEAALRAIRTVGKVPFVWDLDFVEVFSGDAGGFDIIIGNPPYVRQEAIDDPLAPRGLIADELRARKKQYKDALGAAVATRWPRSFGERGPLNLGKRSDLYLYFYLVGLDLLRDGGAFCFITSNSWLDVGYGAALQEFLLTRGQVRLIVDNQVRRSFAESDVNTVIVLLGKPVDSASTRSESLDHVARFVMCQVPFELMLDPVPWVEIAEARDRKAMPEYRVFPATQRWLREQGVDPEKQRYAGDKWGGKYLRAPDIYWTILEKGKGKLVRLGQVAQVAYGLKSGINAFFHMTKDVVKQWNIETEYLKAFLFSLKEAESIRIDATAFKYSLLVCSQTKETLYRRGHFNALRYIEWGETQTTPNGTPWPRVPSVRGRRLWYDVGVQNRADFVCNQFVGDRFLFPRGGDFYVGNVFWVGTCTTGAPDALLARLNSTLTALSAEVIGRKTYGIGVMYLYGPEMRSIFLVDSRFWDSAIKSEASTALGQMGRRKIVRISDEINLADRRALDDIIFDVLGLTRGERDAVYEAVINLVEARLSKAESV